MPWIRVVATGITFWVVVALSVLLVLGRDDVATAQEEPQLTAQIRLLGTRIRTEAPFTLVVAFRWNQPSLLTGTLELRFVDRTRLLGQFSTDPLALRAGDQRLLVPSPGLSKEWLSQEVRVEAQFRAVGRTWDLGSHLLALNTPSCRTFSVLCISERGWDSLSESDGQSSSALRRHPGFTESSARAFAASLRVEPTVPSQPPGRRQKLATSVVFEKPADVTDDPLGFLAHDVVVAAGDGFGYLDASQLTALSRWVRAGGRLAVIPGPTIQSTQVSFLRELLPGQPFFLGTEDGGFRVGPGLPTRGVVMTRVALGKVAVLAPDSEAVLDSTSSEQRRVAAFLWGLSTDEALHLYLRGVWSSSAVNLLGRPQQRFSTEDAIQVLVSGGALHEVPVLLVLALLLLYLLWVGPVEYVVLGRMGRRRWTWITFPLASLGFTVFLLGLSEWYLGGRGDHGSLTIVDLDTTGEFLRETRIELSYSSREHSRSVSVAAAVETPLVTAGRVPREVRGSFPRDYQVVEIIYRGVPHLHRTLTFESSPLAESAWPSPERRGLERVEDLLVGIETEAQLADQRRTLVAALGGDDPSSSVYVRLPSAGRVISLGRSPAVLPASMVAELSFAPPRPIRRLAPHGGASLEDVLLEFGRETLVLVVAKRVGSDIVLYRVLWEEA